MIVNNFFGTALDGGACRRDGCRSGSLSCGSRGHGGRFPAVGGCVGLVATGGRTVYDQEAYAVYGMAQQLLFAFQKRMKAVDEIPRQACRRGREVQFGCFHRLMQDWMPKAPSRAVTAAATTFRTMFHTFRFCSAGLDIGFYFN